MPAIEVLSAEHELILRVLEALSGEVDAGRAGKPVDAKFLGRVAEWLGHWADGAHHEKEERGLFAAMIRHGVPADRGPLACMGAEHDQGRALTAMMRDAAERPEALGDLLDAASAYRALLLAHIAKEEQAIYPMARRLLGAAELVRLEGEYRGLSASTLHEFRAATAELLGGRGSLQR